MLHNTFKHLIPIFFNKIIRIFYKTKIDISKNKTFHALCEIYRMIKISSSCFKLIKPRMNERSHS